MNIFQKNKIKKQILDNIGYANSIIIKANNCLAPAHNIYWSHNLNLPRTFEDDDHLVKLQKAIPSLFTLLHEFVDIYQINAKLSSDFPDLSDFSSDYFIRNLKILQNTIKSRIKDIHTLPDYKTSKDLIKTNIILNKALTYVTSKLEIVCKIDNVETCI